MRRSKLAVLVSAAMVSCCLLFASAAMAQQTVTIDAVDSPQFGWDPSTVTVTTGDTVRWEFDETSAFHTVTSTSSNWTKDENRAAGGAPVTHTFTAPGTYTFVCSAHPSTMTGSVTVEAPPEPPTADDFEKVTIDDDTSNPMELDVANDGRVFFIERTGQLRVWKPDTEQTVTAGTIPVTTSQENGLLGLQLAPDFDTSQWVYLFYSLLPDSSNTQVIARFKMNGDTLDLGSEQRILTFTHQRGQCCHSSGSLYFGPDGSLYISTGDNTNPFDSNGFNPIDERPGREAWDAQRTAANTNDLNGKILRIKPVDIPTGAPGVGTTYTIPAGNLFAPGTASTRPEIYGMGFRNPFRFTVDQETSWVLMGDYGPDASATNANRGPQGSVEYNALSQAGNYGWPYCIRDNTAYNDYNFATSQSGAKFDCANPVNDSPNNTGLTSLPPAIGADAWMGYSEQDQRFTPDLGTGGAPMGGPRYHYDPGLQSARKFPRFYDDQWFIAEWNNNWIKTATLNDQGAMTDVSAFARGTGYLRPMDLDFGPDGALYVIEWGSGFNGNNANSGVYRIDYTAGDQAPIAHAEATPESGLAPLEVAFSSAGSNDPEGTTITYAWDFDSDGTTDSTQPNPTHTYTESGTYTAKLTVTDEGGLTGVDNVQIVVGNRAPQVTIEIPENGQFAAFTDRIPYRVVVTDPEDGSTANGSIDCADVRIDVLLGHDQHSHSLSQTTGCQGTVDTGLAAGHGPEANTFTVIGVSYTDEGATGTSALIGRAEAILQPKQKQAEFFASTGRVPDGATAGDPGVQTETTADTAGGGLNIGFIEDGDYVSYEPMNLKDIDSVRFRVASAGAGGTIELHLDSPTGELIGTTANITPTGNWQSFKDVALPISGQSGTHELFVVFRNRGNTGSLMNVNWIDFHGKGGAVTAAPDVTATATPPTGTAPLSVAFNATASDPDAEAGDTLTYAWDFGVPGTDADTSALEDPTYIYQQPGNYVATVTVTDPDGGRTSTTVPVRADAPGEECPQGFRDDFNGSDLAAPWEVVRRNQNLTVSGGTLNIPVAAGDLYQGTNTAANVVLRPAPAGAWEAIAKINFKGTAQYHQAGLIVYGDDNNYTKLDRVSTNQPTGTPTEKFEFINEVNATARNTNQDYTPNLAATFPQDYYVRIVSNGTQITGSYSTDGQTWTNVGRAANLPANPRVGLLALSNAATTTPMAQFDWFTLTGENVPSADIGAGDGFNGSSLNKERWNAIVREEPANYQVSGGNLTITTVGGDIYQTGDPSGTRNFLLQTADHAGADYVLETKLSSTADNGGYQQGGILVYTDDDNFVKLDAISDQNQTRINRIELRSETAAATGQPQPQVNVPAGTANIWLRLTKLGANYSGEYSYDGTTWTSVGAAVTHTQAAPRFGLFTLGVNSPGRTFSFDYFKVDGELGCEEPEPENTPPAISTAAADPTGGIAPLPVSFSVAATDADGDPLTYAWDFDGNGSTDSTSEDPSHTYAAGGTFNAKVTVSDGEAEATRTITVTVLAPDDEEAGFRALVFSKTAGFRHSNIDEGIAAIRQLGTENDFQVDASEDASLFRDDVLEHYDTVIWLSTTGDVLNDSQQAAFERFVQAGGGFTGIHAAADTEYTWPWYGQLVGAYFRNHPSGTPTAVVEVEDTADPSTEGLPERWTRTDEWYNYQRPVDPVVGGGGDDYSPRGGDLHVLLRMDESTYAEADGSDGVDDDHPISWCKRYDGGRSWYTGMGHTEASFTEAGFLSHILAGMEIAAGVTPSETCGVEASQNQPPTVAPTRNPTGNVRVGIPVAFTANAADPDGDPLTYLWDFGDGETSTEENPTHTFLQAATRTVTVTVTDPDDATASATLPVTVQANRNPSANGLSATPQAGFAPLQVSFNGAATDPDGHTVSYSWDLDGDGTDDTTAQNPTFTYPAAGTYSPRVRVTDPFGGATTRTFTVNVIPEAGDPEARFRVLVFSKTAAFRHSNIDEGIAAIRLLGEQQDFQVDAVEESSLFTDEVLARYDAVIFLSTTGDVLNDAQQAAFERFIKAGGGYAGIHAAADTEYTWPWYGQLVGAYFRNHPNGTPTATVEVEDADDHSTLGLPARWTRTDEWYNYQSPVAPNVGGGGTDYSARDTGVHVLLKMDESTYAEADGSDGVDDDHPISWCRAYDGGRSWYTGMGHTEASFLEPGFLSHILGGIEEAAGVAASESCGFSVETEEPGTPGGDVPGTLSLSLGATPSFGAFTPGIARDYTTSVTANVISTAEGTALTVHDPSAFATGHLVNGSYSLASPLEAMATNGANPTGVFGPVGGAANRLTLLQYPGPVSNDAVTIGLKQSISANEPLRTGRYSKELTFTLSTNSP